MERILRIEELTTKEGYTSYSGYSVITDKQSILLAIGDQQNCCENWGYFWTNDNINEFIGASVLSVDIVNDILIKEKAPELYEGSLMYVNIETDRGTLQFTAYNEHNGYYSHSAMVRCTQLTHDEYL